MFSEILCSVGEKTKFPITTIEIVCGLIVVLVVLMLFKSVRVVPQKEEWIVERLGKYLSTLKGGLHFLIPFVDKIKYMRDMKEMAIDVPPQQCVTRDNIMVEIDGVLYLQVTDAFKASYGIENYLFACTQLAQTTLRSEVGKLELDKTFEERAAINEAVCHEVDLASDPWGVKIKRYEIKTITPPHSVLDAMEKQMRAEREKRAAIAESEGDRQSRINRAEGEKQEAIAKSEGERTRRINEADGRAKEILLIAEATANGLREIAKAISATEGGKDAMNLRLAEQYISEFGKLAKVNNTMIMPTDLANVSGFIKTATTVIEKAKTEIKQ